jgi:hypothetical protein
MLVLYYGGVIFSDEHFSRQYGFWQPYVEQVIYRYLDCGDLHNGFARVKCRLQAVILTSIPNRKSLIGR